MMRFVIFLALLLGQALPVLAAEVAVPEPSIRYRVSGVAQNDLLNVRNQAGVNGKTVGTLAPNAGGIIVTGARQDRDGWAWWEVVYPRAQGGTAWVNSHFLTPNAPNATQETNYSLICTGTEPFWSLQIQAGKATYSLAGGHDRAFLSSAWTSAHGTRGQFAIRLGDPGKAGKIGYAVILRNAACSDGMSDTLYPFNGLVILPDGTVYGGCCHRVAP